MINEPIVPRVILRVCGFDSIDIGMVCLYSHLQVGTYRVQAERGGEVSRDERQFLVQEKRLLPAWR